MIIHVDLLELILTWKEFAGVAANELNYVAKIHTLLSHVEWPNYIST